MSYLDSRLDRNKAFVQQQSGAGTLMPSLPKAMSNVKATIIGCADLRVDPAQILGLEPGEAVVLRNIDSRITPRLLEQLGMPGCVGQVAGEAPGGGGEFHLIVLHTDCGITRLAGDPALLTHSFQNQGRRTPGQAVRDPHAAVVANVAMLRSVPVLPAAWLLSGLVYDVATGVIEVVGRRHPFGLDTVVIVFR